MDGAESRYLSRALIIFYGTLPMAREKEGKERVNKRTRRRERTGRAFDVEVPFEKALVRWQGFSRGREREKDGRTSCRG